MGSHWRTMEVLTFVLAFSEGLHEKRLLIWWDMWEHRIVCLWKTADIPSFPAFGDLLSEINFSIITVLKAPKCWPFLVRRREDSYEEALLKLCILKLCSVQIWTACFLICCITMPHRDYTPDRRKQNLPACTHELSWVCRQFDPCSFKSTLCPMGIVPDERHTGHSSRSGKEIIRSLNVFRLPNPLRVCLSI